MSDAADKIIATAVERNLDMRTAAFVNAINRLHEYYTLTGYGSWLCMFIYLQFKIESKNNLWNYWILLSLNYIAFSIKID